MHARGTGAHGYFKLLEPIPELSCAGILNDTSRTTPMFVRFSTVLGSRGSADTVRDVRGFAMKFYTEEGNWDIVGNNFPVFFIQVRNSSVMPKRTSLTSMHRTPSNSPMLFMPESRNLITKFPKLSLRTTTFGISNICTRRLRICSHGL